MTELKICTDCGQQHPISDIELSFKRPDDYLLVPPEEREQRTQSNDDLCAIWGNDDASHRYFVKALLPLYVQEWSEQYAGPDTRPEFQFAPSAHSLFLEQERGITAHRASEYSAYVLS